MARRQHPTSVRPPLGRTCLSLHNRIAAAIGGHWANGHGRAFTGQQLYHLAYMWRLGHWAHGHGRTLDRAQANGQTGGGHGAFTGTAAIGGHWANGHGRPLDRAQAAGQADMGRRARMKLCMPLVLFVPVLPPCPAMALMASLPCHDPYAALPSSSLPFPGHGLRARVGVRSTRSWLSRRFRSLMSHDARAHPSYPVQVFDGDGVSPLTGPCRGLLEALRAAGDADGIAAVFGPQDDVERAAMLLVRGFNDEPLSLFGRVFLRTILFGLAKTRYAPHNGPSTWRHPVLTSAPGPSL